MRGVWISPAILPRTADLLHTIRDGEIVSDTKWYINKNRKIERGRKRTRSRPYRVCAGGGGGV